MRHALLLLCALAVVPALARAQEAPASSAALPPELAEITVSWEPAKSEALKPIEAILRANASIPWILREADGYFDFPRPLTIRFTEAGDVNAWYSPDEHSVTFSYDLTAYFVNMYLGIGTEPAAALELASQASTWVLLHEFGHAIIGEMQLPTTGKEEDSADEFATIICTKVLPPTEIAPAKAAALWFQVSGSRIQKTSDLLFWDEHSLDMQRAYRILANLFAADPKKFRFLEKEVPAERLQAAQVRWPGKAAHWNRLMLPWVEAPHGGRPDLRGAALWPPGGRPVDAGRMRVVFGPTSDPVGQNLAANTVISDGIAAVGAALGKGLLLPHDVTIRVTDAVPGRPVYDHYKHEATLDMRSVVAMGEAIHAAFPPEQAILVFVNALMFRVLETTVHALIEVLDLPYTGEPEDAALELIMLLAMSDPSTHDMVLSAAVWYDLASGAETDATSLAYWSAGSLDQQRFSDLLCYLHASDPESYGSVEARIPAQRLGRCARDLPRKLANWELLLQPHIKAAAAP